MRKRDGSKLTRSERASLIPSEPRSSLAPPTIQGVPVTARVSVPPSSTLVRSELKEGGWGELGTGSTPSMIPKAPPPPRFGASASLRPDAPRASLRPEPAGRPGSQWPEPRSRSDASKLKSSQYPPESPEGDRLYRHALLLREQGRGQETLAKLEELYRGDPNHLEGRVLLHKLITETGREAIAAEHTEWVIGHYAKRGAHGEVCAAYRRTRMAFVELALPESVLQHVILSADRVNETRVILDATKLLLQRFPNSPVLGQALFASARVQATEGRPDLARNTLQMLISRFPRDPLAAEARRRLLDLGP
jgi:hypothetical protein